MTNQVQCVLFYRMVSNYKRKTTRQSWDEKNMRQALAAVEREEMGWLKASRQYSVPQATLRRRAKNKNKFTNKSEKGLGSIAPTLDDEMERDLVNHALELESRMFGLTARELRSLAYEIAESNGVRHSFNQEKKLEAGTSSAGQ